mmetsp:Transcript_1135/g.1992  ORF Transcript_1135/g.1992 Transcript_1135/m.1992 type:complete len:215 (-) Transcript_1135:218-862(-)
MMITTAATFLGGCFLLGGGTLCLATGLYYLAEIVEENIRTTRKVLGVAIKGTVALNTLLCTVDGLPISCTVTGILAQLSYLQLLKGFPFVPCSDIRFIASTGMLIVNHCLWMHHFLDTDLPIESILSFFFLAVWLVPFGFMISLAANDNMLPGSNGYHKMNGGGVQQHQGSGKGGRTMVLQAFSFLQAQRDAVLPHATQSFPSKSAPYVHSHKA